jgi:hypothetical protein
MQSPALATQTKQSFVKTHEIQHAGNGRMRRFPPAALFSKEPSITPGDTAT